MLATIRGELLRVDDRLPILAARTMTQHRDRSLTQWAVSAGAIGFAVFILAGSSLAGLWAGIVVMWVFSFAESPQLQALLADIAPPSIRDASFAVYFTLAFGVGSLWVAVYGLIIGVAGEATGVPIAFMLMAVTFLLAALATIPIRAEGRARENADHEASMGEF